MKYPYSVFITNLLVNSWRHDHVVIFDDSVEVECYWELSRRYKYRSIALWNELINLFGGILIDLAPL